MLTNTQTTINPNNKLKIAVRSTVVHINSYKFFS